MEPRRPLYIAPARVPLRPLVRLAVRVLGPGPLRLRMVKFSHELVDYDHVSALAMKEAA